MANFLRITLVLSTTFGLARSYTVVAMQGFMNKNVDPIIRNGKYNTHMHNFMGSDAINATTTTSAELKKGCTTAENPNDMSSYWIPTLYLTAGKSNTAEYTPIAPARFSAYYENIAEAEIPIPENFKLLVGNAEATTQAKVPTYEERDKQEPIVRWFCEGENEPVGKEPSAFPTSTCPTMLQQLVYFHDCVNPTKLSESSNSAAKNTAPNKCPAGQKRIPRLRFSVRFDLRNTLPNGWKGEPPLKLSCGNSFCAHGDFINGWDDLALKNMLKANDRREYMFVGGSKQAAGPGGPPKCTPKDNDPKRGTSEYLESQRVKVGAKKRALEWEA